MGLPESQRINQFLSTTGGLNAITNQATSIYRVWKYIPTSTQRAYLTRLNVNVEDNATWDAAKYAGAAALNTGIEIALMNANGTVVNFTPRKIKKIHHWASLSGVDVYHTNFASGNNMFTVRWTFEKGGRELVVDGSKGEYLQMRMWTSLASLVEHEACVQGFWETVG